MNGTMESIGIIGSITDLSKYPIIWLMTEYGRAIAKIKLELYTKIIAYFLFRANVVAKTSTGA